MKAICKLLNFDSVLDRLFDHPIHKYVFVDVDCREGGGIEITLL